MLSSSTAHYTKIISSLIATALVAVAMTTPANSAVFQFSFTGSITSVGPDLASQFAIGEAVDGWFTYESEATDSNPDPSVGLYSFSFIEAEFQFGSYSGTGSDGAVQVEDQLTFESDRFVATARSAGSPIGDFDLRQFTIQLRDSTGTALSSDGIPTSFEILDFDDRSAFLGFSRLGQFPMLDFQFVRASIDSITTTQVPEPSASLLQSVALLVFALRKKFIP